MEFPVPDDSPVVRPSIAERDRSVVLGVSILLLVPIALLCALVFDMLLAIFVGTFIVGMVAATALAFCLRSRFIASFSRADLAVLQSGRSLTSRAQRHADDLVASGFALTEVVVVGDESGRVFTRPLGLFRRVQDDLVAIAGELGVQMVSRYGDGALLVTASHDVVEHHGILVQLEPDATTAEVAASHNAAISQLRSNFDLEPRPLTPSAGLLSIEQREQQTLRERRGLDTLNRALAASPDPMSFEAVREWLRGESVLDGHK